jgi:hypothetical protein
MPPPLPPLVEASPELPPLPGIVDERVISGSPPQSTTARAIAEVKSSAPSEPVGMELDRAGIPRDLRAQSPG